MLKVGFIGWRGMVGSVLMQRMLEDGDFKGIEPTFFSTSQVGQAGPDVGVDVPPLKDAFDLEALKALDVVVTCQGVHRESLWRPAPRRLEGLLGRCR